MARQKRLPIALGVLKRPKITNASRQTDSPAPDLVRRAPQSQDGRKQRRPSLPSTNRATISVTPGFTRSSAASSASSASPDLSADSEFAVGGLGGGQIDVQTPDVSSNVAVEAQPFRDRSIGKRHRIQRNDDEIGEVDDDDDDDDLNEPTSAQTGRSRGNRPRQQQVQLTSQRPAKAPRLRGPLRGLSLMNVLPTPNSFGRSVDSEHDKHDESDDDASFGRHQRSNVRPLEVKRHVTRAVRNGRSDANYDMKYHPMDSITRPKRAARRLKGSRHRCGLTVDIETDEEAEHGFEGPSSSDDQDISTDDDDASVVDSEAPERRKPDPLASRRSSRSLAARFVDYNQKHHPQDHLLPFHRGRAAIALPAKPKRGRANSSPVQGHSRKKLLKDDELTPKSPKVGTGSVAGRRRDSKDKAQKTSRKSGRDTDELVEFAITSSRAGTPAPGNGDIVSDLPSTPSDIDVNHLLDSAINGAISMQDGPNEKDSGWLERSSNDFLRQMEASQRSDVGLFHDDDELHASYSDDEVDVVARESQRNNSAFEDAMISNENDTLPAKSAESAFILSDGPLPASPSSGGSNQAASENDNQSTPGQRTTRCDDDNDEDDDEDENNEDDENNDDDSDDDSSIDNYKGTKYDEAVALMQMPLDAPSIFASPSQSSANFLHLEVTCEGHGRMELNEVELSPADPYSSLVLPSTASSKKIVRADSVISRDLDAERRSHWNATPPSGQGKTATAVLRDVTTDYSVAPSVDIGAPSAFLEHERSQVIGD